MALEIKAFWRYAGGRVCCFHKHSRTGEYVSLCGRHEIGSPGSQHRARPPPMIRCPICERKEESLHESRGYGTPLDAQDDWREHIHDHD